MTLADDDHFAAVGEKLAGGRLIPFLGAGANLGGQQEHRDWQPGGPFLPSGRDLADHLARRGRYPLPDDRNLSRVAQYVGAARGEDELYLYVREVLAGSYGPTSLHRLLARVARYLSEAGLAQLLVVTSNYDDLVEVALAEQGLDFDIVWYEAKQRASAKGRFMHRAPGRAPVPVTRPNKYAGLPITLERPAILKLHGCLDREDPTEDSYVITEDSYIGYLSNGDVGALIPISLWQRLTRSSLLFLGYALRDWNLRVVLNRVFEVHKLQAKSWAVLLEADDPDRSKVERALWGARSDIDPIHCELAQYVRGLETALSAVDSRLAS